jgi:hypothetical protein
MKKNYFNKDKLTGIGKGNIKKMMKEIKKFNNYNFSFYGLKRKNRRGYNKYPVKRVKWKINTYNNLIKEIRILVNILIPFKEG